MTNPRYGSSLYLSVIIILVISAPLQVFFVPTSAQALGSACDAKLRLNAMAAGTDANNARAEWLALSSPFVDTALQGDIITSFVGVFETWTVGVTCSIELQTYNAVFAVYNATGFEHYLIVTEDAALNSVTSLSIQDSKFSAITYYGASGGPIWSGDGFEYVSGGVAQPVGEVSASWVQPAVSVPPWKACGYPTSSVGCSLAIWTGLYPLSQSGLAQGGSQGYIICYLGSCSTTYTIWTEFLPDQQYEVACSSNVHAGDSISSVAWNDNTNNPTAYYAVVHDLTTGAVCSASHSAANIGTTIEGLFIGERALQAGVRTPLARFSSFTFTGIQVNYGSPLVTMTGYFQLQMINPYPPVPSSVHNILVAENLPSLQITQTWNTSANT